MIRRPAAPATRPGTVLLVVLVVLVLLTLAAYQYSELMTAEYVAADSHRRSVQARAFAESGVHYTAALLADPSSRPANIFDDAQAFGSFLVQENEIARFQGRFSVVAPLGSDEQGGGQGFRHGVTDEGGKINLNALLAIDSSGRVAYDMLLKLPNMTEETANAILDWLDPDDTPRSNGAENNYYATLSPPYRCKNGPLDSLDELLLVRGVTPQLLWGNDRNRNGVLDPGEDAGLGTLDQGWSALLTIHSREQNIDAQGQARVYINDQDLNGLYEKLNTAVGPDLANFIVAYRIYGSASGSSGSGSSGGSSKTGGGSSKGGGGSSRGGSSKGGSSKGGGGASGGRLTRDMIDFQRGRPRAIGSLFELINTSVSIPSSDPEQPAKSFPSPLNDRGAQRQLLPKLLDMVTTVRDAELPGRVNINTAPRDVLAALPGLTGADVTNIVGRRPDIASAEQADAVYQTPAWLLTEANLPPQTLRTLERYITARSQVYRVQVVGHFDGSGPTARVEAVIDTNNGRPRILYYRDLTELGRGFNLTKQ
ncbi:MAG: general secretion pathway protein GspK [Planctomycetia bacterium]|nr:general secretion pathway protein GspK [Planctomycetia bacterium]